MEGAGTEIGTPPARPKAARPSGYLLSLLVLPSPEAVLSPAPALSADLDDPFEWPDVVEPELDDFDRLSVQ